MRSCTSRRVPDVSTLFRQPTAPHLAAFILPSFGRRVSVRVSHAVLGCHGAPCRAPSWPRGGEPMKSWFENKARRSFWSVHVDALRRSGVSRTEYCRRHRLNKSTFDRWLRVLNSLESVREEARKRRKRTREPVCGDKRNKAVQAFWAMHVEALNWSGLTAREYAAAHHISVYSLRTWRARFDADPLQVDWRARLHPSVRPTVSTSKVLDRPLCGAVGSSFYAASFSC